jgi:hypothetical protein
MRKPVCSTSLSLPRQTGVSLRLLPHDKEPTNLSLPRQTGVSLRLIPHGKRGTLEDLPDYLLIQKINLDGANESIISHEHRSRSKIGKSN